MIVVDDPQDVGQRADVVLARHTPGLSRRMARRLALDGHLESGGKRVPPSARVALGDALELRMAAPERPEALETLQVLEVTERFVYVAKPADVHTHGLHPGDRASLADAVGERFPECTGASEDPREGGAIHRLDFETTGVVAFARSSAAWSSARAVMGTSTIEKLYLALSESERMQWPPSRAAGCVETSEARPDVDMPVVPAAERAFSIRAPIGRGPNRRRVEIRPDGQPAQTLLWPLGAGRVEGDAWAWRVLLLLRLGTGRRHQARVHLRWVGLPIVGDAVYGRGGDGGTLCLHAHVLDLSRAFPGEPRVVAPVPVPMLDACQAAALQPWTPPR